jgi:hypothetical protein
MAYVGARVLFALGREVRKARELGSYHLVERIGHGGMGEVWRARHRLLARPAAIKLIHPLGAPSVIGSEAVGRFEREAQAISSLRSPHTVDLFDFGVSDDGTFYYVMELLEGLDAERLVNTYGPLPPARVIHVIRQVCHSLSEAESISLVHRDIKPANIFLSRYGEDCDFVKVLDFGIVKAVHGTGALEAAPTLAALTTEHIVRDAGVHGSGTGARGASPRSPGRYLRDRLRHVLAVDRSARLQRGHADTDPGPARTGRASATVRQDGAADSFRARCARDRVSRQGSCQPATDRARAGATARRHAGRPRVDARARAVLVGDASAGAPTGSGHGRLGAGAHDGRVTGLRHRPRRTRACRRFSPSARGPSTKTRAA